MGVSPQETAIDCGLSYDRTVRMKTLTTQINGAYPVLRFLGEAFSWRTEL